MSLVDDYLEQLLNEQGARTSVQRLQALQAIEDRFVNALAWLRVEEVRLMHAEGARWPAIGRALGCSKQWAQRQYEPLLDVDPPDGGHEQAADLHEETVIVEETTLITPRKGTALLRLRKEIRQLRDARPDGQV